MFESSARVSMSWPRPSRTIRPASSREASASGSSEPSPTLTSSSSRDAPAATFFDMMLAAISGMLETVAVASRSAYRRPSAGASSGVWPDTATPTCSTCRRMPASDSDTRMPGIASSLSSVPPVCPSPRPLILATSTPQAASSGASTSVVESPTPPVECLSATGHGHDTRCPDATIASSNPRVSSSLMPRSTTAIRNAESW